MSTPPPRLTVERDLLAGGARYVLGCDEVGRGALAGPVGVGVAVLDPQRKRIPAGLRDSKLLAEPVREALAPRVAEWAAASAVGLAGNDEVDRHGLSAALGAAGARAVVALAEAGLSLPDAVVLLDGNWDWLSPGLAAAGVAADDRPRVVTRIKADRHCASVAAASVLAKVHRDRLMIDRHETWPVYRWRSNKGYASRAHAAAIGEHGPCEWHRHTWLHSLADGAIEDPSAAAPADDGGSPRS